MEHFKEVSGVLFSDTKSHSPEIVWALKKYIETTEMQSFVDNKTIFSITTITEEEDTYLVNYTICGGRSLMGSRCVVEKSSIVDLVREHKLNNIL